VVSDTIEKGDIVWIEYDAWTVNPNGTLTLFDTTHDEVAKKEGKFDEKKVYIEAPVVVGRGRLFEGLEASLVGAKVGGTIEVLIPPEKGARNGSSSGKRSARKSGWKSRSAGNMGSSPP